MASKKKAFDSMKTEGQDGQGENKKSQREQEEKLILTAWQSMSSTLQQQGFCDSRSPGPSQSFLSKQRQTSHTRRGFWPR